MGRAFLPQANTPLNNYIKNYFRAEDVFGPEREILTSLNTNTLNAVCKNIYRA